MLYQKTACLKFTTTQRSKYGSSSELSWVESKLFFRDRVVFVKDSVKPLGLSAVCEKKTMSAEREFLVLKTREATEGERRAQRVYAKQSSPEAQEVYAKQSSSPWGYSHTSQKLSLGKRLGSGMCNNMEIYTTDQIYNVRGKATIRLRNKKTIKGVFWTFDPATPGQGPH